MVINSKKKSWNCILLRKGGDKLFIHNYFPNPKLPLISINYKIHQNILKSPIFLEKNYFSLDNKNYNTKTNTKYNNYHNTIDNSFKTRTTLFNDTPKIEESSIINNNSSQNNYNKKQKYWT